MTINSNSTFFRSTCYNPPHLMLIFLAILLVEVGPIMKWIMTIMKNLPHHKVVATHLVLNIQVIVHLSINQEQT